MNYFKTFTIIILIIFNNKSLANENIVEILKKNNNIIFIRHALAPGSGDPENINLNDCDTQRNLDLEGINQSKEIGNFFNENNIKIEKIFSSEWCRCKDTALYAFQKYEIFDALNSFYDQKFYKNKNKQVKKLKNFIKNWNNNGNLILVTHFVVIMELLDISPSSGEIIVSNKNYEVLSRKKIN
tara:strand:+ start:502 stop:1053 length:552 start_codon:yes stop_codon:yes gene_type:complete